MGIFLAKEFLASMESLRFPSPLVFVQGFTNHMIWNDTLHVAYRGFAPEFAAGVLVDIFGRGEKLTAAASLVHTWAKLHGHPLSMDLFALSDEKFPSLNAKGFDLKIICLWLEP